jgi:arsenical pump membrane protein
VSEFVALVALATCLASAVARPRWAPDWAVAPLAGLVLFLGGVLSAHQARLTLRTLGPTIGFLAALLLVAEGCAQAGLFNAVGASMAHRSGAAPRRLLALVFAGAAITTAVLSLDATVLLLTPVVFATAARLRLSPRPHVYACAHLANSASLLLPVSNLTNLLALSAAGLSFTHFAALMVLPWLAAVGVEWVVLTRVFAADLRSGAALPARGDDAPWPRFAAIVLALALAGFAASSVVGVAPAWIAVLAAVILAARYRMSPSAMAGAVQPGFLLFVLGLGVVVAAAGVHGLSHLIDQLVPHSSSLPGLLAIAAISAVCANLLNNLPATLVLVPVVGAVGHGAVLAMLIGVGVGPNLTYTGSLATLLWRRVVHAHDADTDALGFLKLGALTVPAGLVASTLGLWLALQVVR